MRGDLYLRSRTVGANHPVLIAFFDRFWRSKHWKKPSSIAWGDRKNKFGLTAELFVESRMPTNALQCLFGPSADVYKQFLDEVGQDLVGAKYRFMNLDEFDHLLANDQSAAAKVYWEELLFRAHWAATSNLLRHKRWLTGCSRIYEDEPNFLAFAACLRGFIEASSDACHSLNQVPLTLAANHRAIAEALTGKANSILTCAELEELLIHFQFARKLEKGEVGLPGHQALTADAYLRTADADMNKSNSFQDQPLTDIGNTVSPDPATLNRVKSVYCALCQIVHPAAFSHLWMSEGREADKQTEVQLELGDDKAWIEDFCKAHVKAIEYLQMCSVNISVLILKVLNRFRRPGLISQSVERLGLVNVAAWSKIESLLAKPYTR